MKVLAALFVGLAGQVIAGDWQVRRPSPQKSLILRRDSTWQVTVGISQNSGQVGLGFDPNRIVPAGKRLPSASQRRAH